MKRLYIACLILSLLITTCGVTNSSDDRIQKGPFTAVITETGEVSSVNSKLITMPEFDGSYGRPKVIDLVDEGTLVKAGDYVGMIDTASVAKELGTKKADLEISKADMNQLQVQLETTLKNLQADLRSAEAAFRKAVIDTQRVQFESETQKEISRLQFVIADIELEKCKEKLLLQDILNREELLIQQEKMKQTLSSIKKAEHTIETFTLRAPSDGMVVYHSERRRGKIAIGSERWPGQGIVQLPDMSKMKILATVNERDAVKIDLGQKVKVKLDAYPKNEFTGKVIYKSKVCRKKDRESKIKIFDIEVLLDDITRIVRPGMTASCEFLISQLNDVLFVKNECVEEEQGQYFIYLIKGTGKKRVQVELGPRNIEHVVVTGDDIKAGDKVVDLARGGA